MRFFARFLGLLVFTACVVSLEPFSLEQRHVAQAQPEEQNARKSEADRLLQQGIQQFRVSQFREALRSWEAALTIYREIGDRQGESHSLGNLGIAYFSLSEYERAIGFHQQSLSIAREIGDRQGEGVSLGNLGIAYSSLGEYEHAIDFYQQYLAIAREIGDRQGESNSLDNLGNVYRFLGEYERAIDFHQQSLTIARKIGDRPGEGASLGSLANVYLSLGEYERAIDFHQQSLAVKRKIGDRQGEGVSLGNLGIAYSSLGEYERAIEFYQQHLAIARETGDRQGESNSLGNLGNAFLSLSEYERAIDFHQQSLTIAREIGDRQGESNSLGNLGNAFLSLGEYERAIDFHQQSLTIAQEIGDRRGESNSLGSLGIAYSFLDEHEWAIDFHQQSLAIKREIGDRRGESNSLGNLGDAYLSLGEYERAIDFHQRSLAIAREIGDRQGEGVSLGSLGIAYFSLSEYERAIDFLQQGLTLAQSIGNRSAAGNLFNNLGRIFAELGQPELAIVFLKTSADIREEIRDDIQGLETGLQQAYTDTVADSYRFLADLLLEEGRIPEAQQVLDLLKIEELREFTNNTRATWTSNGLQYSELEQPVINAHTDLIAFGQTFYECQQTGCDQLTTLNERYKLLIEEYKNQVKEFEATIRDNRRDDFLYENPDNLSGNARELLEANPNSVLIYPVVTDEKLWLVYATARSVGSIKVNVSQGELSRTVQRLGELLSQQPNLASLQATSQELYGWLIKPLEEALESNDVEQLIFVNDRVTRYIPMAVLHDGEQYLIERYAVSSVLSPALTDTSERLGAVDATNVLGLGLTKAVEGFNPLPAVAEELDTIVRSEAADATGIYPGQVHLDEDFTLERIESQVASHRVLHIATHAAFEPGRPDASFIVLGDGNRLEIPDIEAMELLLSNLHLVVLSACQTALGGEIENGDGSEIAGLSSYFLEKGRAEAVLASLWLVDDTGTSLLMQRFYELMASGELTKAEALQQAQLSLLYDQDTETRLDTVRASITVQTTDGVPIAGNTRLQHPYYWAPFILIGNGL